MERIKRTGKILRAYLKELQKEHIGAYAAQAAYFVMLSFIPFVILLLTLLQYTTITKGDVYAIAWAVVPESMSSFVIGIIDEVYSKTLVTVSLSAIMTVWSAGKGFLALMRGMNTIYQTEEHRNYFLLRLHAAFYTLVFVIVIIFSLVLLVFGNTIHRIALEHFPFVAIVTGILVGFKDILALGALTLVFMALYKFVPNHKTGFLRQAPGAVFAAVSWYLFSIGFSVYVNVSPGLNNMYGSLTTLVLVMLWLYFCMYILLLGVRINKGIPRGKP